MSENGGLGLLLLGIEVARVAAEKVSLLGRLRQVGTVGVEVATAVLAAHKADGRAGLQTA